jgi:hypothetical protein
MSAECTSNPAIAPAEEDVRTHAPRRSPTRLAVPVILLVDDA